MVLLTQIKQSDSPDPKPSDNGAVDVDRLDFTTAAPAEPSAPDPFDPERLRLSQDFAASVGVKKALLSIPVRKPSKELFVRVHPDESYRITTAVIELKEEDRDIYLVAPSLREELGTESTLRPVIIFTATRFQQRVMDRGADLNPPSTTTYEPSNNSRAGSSETGGPETIGCNIYRGETSKLPA